VIGLYTQIELGQPQIDRRDGRRGLPAAGVRDTQLFRQHHRGRIGPAQTVVLHEHGAVDDEHTVAAQRGRGIDLAGREGRRPGGTGIRERELQGRERLRALDQGAARQCQTAEEDDRRNEHVADDAAVHSCFSGT